MGEIADMMLDGTMDCETGEWNFDGEDGPGFPMTGAEAAEYQRATGHGRRRGGIRKLIGPGEPRFKVSKKLRAQVEKFGELRQNDPYHWQLRKDGKLVADWWPHKRKWRMGGTIHLGHEVAFLEALAAREPPQ